MAARGISCEAETKNVGDFYRICHGISNSIFWFPNSVWEPSSLKLRFVFG
jgi:hypothetical protein